MSVYYTPGPWMDWDGDEENAVSTGQKPDGSFPIVAIVRGGSKKANARLIAAAPDMLEKGMQLVDRDCYYENGNIVIPCGLHGDAIRIMREFRSALAKATGKS